MAALVTMLFENVILILQ